MLQLLKFKAETMITGTQKGETPSAVNAEGSFVQTAPVVWPDHRPQWCAIREGSDMAMTHMTRRA